MEKTLKNVLVVHSAITAKQFCRFSYFNGLFLKRRYLGLLLFAILLLLFGWCNLITGSPGLFWLFTATGILVPGIYLAQYVKSIKAQAAALHLSETPQNVYQVSFNERGICIDRLREHLSYDWNDLNSAHRVGDCTFLYYAPQRALILPDSSIESAGPEALWSLLENHMPEKSLKKWRIKL